jgi:non-homologous end joining protein Ku
MWKRSISFELVNIPVKLYSSTLPKDISFNLLHLSDERIISTKKCVRSAVKKFHVMESLKVTKHQKMKNREFMEWFSNKIRELRLTSPL